MGRVEPSTEYTIVPPLLKEGFMLSWKPASFSSRSPAERRGFLEYGFYFHSQLCTFFGACSSEWGVGSDDGTPKVRLDSLRLSRELKCQCT